jgi:predicted ester cyclase
LAFPDLHHTIEDMIAEGDRVVTRLTAEGSNTGQFYGMPATGKPVRVSEIAIFRIADGKIVEQWPQSDALGMMQQLGMIPTPGSPAG